MKRGSLCRCKTESRRKQGVFMNFSFIFDNIYCHLSEDDMYMNILNMCDAYIIKPQVHFSPKKYVDVMGEARHVDFLQLIVNLQYMKNVHMTNQHINKTFQCSVVYIFSTCHTSFPYYNEILLDCYPSLVCFQQRMTCACSKRVPFEQISQRGYRYGYAP